MRFWIIASTILVVGIAMMWSIITLTMRMESPLLRVVLLAVGIGSGAGTAYFFVNCPWYYKKER